MRKDWTETTLGEIAEVNMGQSPPGDTYNTEGIGMPFMQGSAEFGEHYPEPVKFCSAPAKIAEIGDLLLSVRAPVGDSNFANQRIAIGRGLATVRARTGADTHFLRLVIQLNTAGLLATSGTGMFSSITGKNLREFGVNLPPLLEQKRIVDVVSSVDAYIDALQQQADSARRARNAVLHQLLSAGGGEWVTTTLGKIAKFHNGKTYKQEELLENGKYRVLRVGNFFSNGNWYWTDLELEENKYCDKGDLLYAWSASFGPRIWKEEKVVYHYHIWKIVEDPELIDKTFLYYWLDEDVQRMKRDTGNGSIMMHITKSGIEARAIALPPIVDQKRIVEIVSSMDDVIQATEQAVLDAKNLRSGLLSDLLSGEHEIPASYDSLLGAA